MAEPRDTEIRFMVTRQLAQRIDALVQSDCHQGRAELLTPLIEAMVEKRVHAAIVLLRMAGINPADAQTGNGGDGEAPRLPRSGDGN